MYTIGQQMETRASLLEGGPLAAKIKQEVKTEIEEMVRAHGVRPSLATLLVGDDPASAVYVGNKIKACEEVGIRSEHHALPESTTTAELLDLIASLNSRDDVDGILTQLPLPAGIEERAIIEAINPAKDVDGFHPMNVGNLALGRPAFVPCTPAGIIELLVHNGVEIRGARACVVGRSQIVGRPMAQLLLQRDATVTICHSRTRDLPAMARTADILVAAIGRPAFVTPDFVKPGAVVIDVGINSVTSADEAKRIFGRYPDRLQVFEKRGAVLVGDVHPDVAEKAGALTPVPGGVGPLTIAMLMANTVRAAELRIR